MSDLAMIPFAIALGGAIGFVMQRLFFKFFDSMDRFPAALKGTIALVVFAAITGLIDVLALRGAIPVGIAFSVGFGAVFYFYVPRMS